MNETYESSNAAAGILAGLGMGFMVFLLAVVVYTIIVYWKIFEKAGQPGWAAIIPIYNLIVYFKVIGRPGIWILLYLGLYILMIVAGTMGSAGAILSLLSSIAFIVIWVIDLNRLSKSFGQSVLFTIGLVIPVANIICLSLLAFSKSYQYIGPNGVGDGSETANDNPQILHS